MTLSAVDMELDAVIAVTGAGRGKGRKGGFKGDAKGGKGRGHASINTGGSVNTLKSDESCSKDDSAQIRKLDMSLDDVVQADFVEGKSNGGESKSKGKAKHKSDDSRGPKSWNTSYDKKKWSSWNWHSAKSSATPTGKSKMGTWDKWGSSKSGGGGGDGSAWESWGSSKPSNGNKHDHWPVANKRDGRGGGAKSEWTSQWNQKDDWGARADAGGWGSYSKHGRDGSSSGSGAWARRGGGNDEWWSGEQHEEDDEGEGVPSPPNRRAERDGRASRTDASRGGGHANLQRRKRDEDQASGQGGRPKRIKVSNIARDLDERDIKEAFEPQIGRVLNCVLENRTAFLTFGKPEHAQKAVDTFDRGELNGRTIAVTFDD
eukprot:TRINITY_DN71877_c0_g1_i1.p1 TRINITY_DN71877_c0_g1~~TRINITY_DN71877_c0_g1_i1.p1  ORF type:complete len:374 (+),score=74.30 TRINITY_DN71877_c0_g1_i1:112-1233(+)